MSFEIPEGFYDFDEVVREARAKYTPEELAKEPELIERADEQLELAELVYNMRTGAGMTQQELAEKTGSSQPFISAVERGARIPTYATVRKFARATGNRLRITAYPAGDTGMASNARIAGHAAHAVNQGRGPVGSWSEKTVSVRTRPDDLRNMNWRLEVDHEPQGPWACDLVRSGSLPGRKSLRRLR